MTNLPTPDTPPSLIMPGIQKDSGLAIASLITGNVAWLVVPLLGALAAIITGHLAKKEIRESNGTITGGGMATAGLILGYIQLCFMVFALIALIIFLVTTPHLFDGFRNINLRF